MHLDEFSKGLMIALGALIALWSLDRSATG
jgi:hypothetical protein